MKNRVLFLLVFLAQCSIFRKPDGAQLQEIPFEQRFLEEEMQEEIDTSELQVYRYADGEINVYKFVFEPRLYCCDDFFGLMEIRNDTVFLIAKYKWTDPRHGKKPERLVPIEGDSYQVYHFRLEQDKIPADAIFVFKRKS